MKEVLAEIITIGDEILIGQIIDSNSAWMGDKLNDKGIKVHRISSISDSKDAIVSTLQKSLQDVDLILITGGLGPTKDDITKHTLAEFFNTPLVKDDTTYQKLETFFNKRGINFNQLNKGQAQLPKECTILENALGTAQGMLFKQNGKIIISMPGVPYEMKHIMEERVLPNLSSFFSLPSIYHRTILTVGVPESELAERINHWEESLPNHIKLAYLPSYGRVRLRLSAFGDNLNQLKKDVAIFENSLMSHIEKDIFGYGNISFEEALGNLLVEKQKTLATAESCTGGFIASSLVNVAGSSAYFKGSIVAYSNEVKINVLGVEETSIQKEGAVSETVVQQMAENVRIKCGATIGVATSGVAGPTGGTEEKPVGTVWIALADGKKTITKKLNLASSREVNIKRTAIYIMNLIRMYLNE